MRPLIAAAALASVPYIPALAQSAVDPELQRVLERMAGYVARYAERASAIVAVERYTQSVVVDGRLPIKPRKLHREFGIWLPAKMSEFYNGPLVVAAGTAPVAARASTLASYSDCKQFTTAVRIK